MKKIILNLALLILPILVIAQSPAEKLFKKYAGKDGFTTININKGMFELFAQIDNKGSEEFDEVVSGLENIKILTSSVVDVDLDVHANFLKDIKALNVSGYEELMTINKKDEDIKFLIKKKEKGKISELLVIVYKKNEGVLIRVSGEIDLKNISKLSRSVKIDGLEHLEDIEDELEDDN